MSFQIETGMLGQVAMLPEVRNAAKVGAKLIGLWPLQEAIRMANDVQYAETLQVRVTRAVAQLILGTEVPMADAEFVYDGAQSIPGRPDAEVAVLVDVTEAYEQMADYFESGDTTQIMAGAGDMKVSWSGQAVTQISNALQTVETLIGTGTHEGNQGAQSADVESVSQRFSLVCVAYAELLGILSEDSAAQDADATQVLARRSAPLPLYANELCERLSLPRLALQPDDLLRLVNVYVGDGAVQNDVEIVQHVTSILAPLAAKEWQHHYDEVVYDAEAAKKAAEEKEEKEKKAKLAAKFADIPEDPNKEPVDL